MSAERVGRNEARFRASNEELEEYADALGFAGDELTPFLCECADPSCTTVVRLSRTEYEHVRRSPVRFLYAVGHEANANGWARVVEEFDRYTIAEKLGEAADAAAALDAREGTADGRA